MPCRGLPAPPSSSSSRSPSRRSSCRPRASRLRPKAVARRWSSRRPSLVFEKTTVGNQSPSKEVDLYNEGEEEAPIDKIAIEGEDAGAFNLNSSSCGAIFQGQHCGLWFTFMPNSPGEKQATAVITFKNGRPGAELRDLRHRGRAAADLLALQLRLRAAAGLRKPQRPAAADQQRRSRGAAQQLRNARRQRRLLDRQQQTAGAGSLQPGQSCNVEVNFNAQDASPTRPNCGRPRTATASPPRSAATAGGRSSRPPRTRRLRRRSRSARVGPVADDHRHQLRQHPGRLLHRHRRRRRLRQLPAARRELHRRRLMPAASCTAQVRFRPQDAGPKAAYWPSSATTTAAPWSG